MQLQQLAPDSITFGALINACGKAGCWQMAVAILEVAKRSKKAKRRVKQGKIGDTWMNVGCFFFLWGLMVLAQFFDATDLGEVKFWRVLVDLRHRLTWNLPSDVLIDFSILFQSCLKGHFTGSSMIHAESSFDLIPVI